MLQIPVKTEKQLSLGIRSKLCWDSWYKLQGPVRCTSCGRHHPQLGPPAPAPALRVKPATGQANSKGGSDVR